MGLVLFGLYHFGDQITKRKGVGEKKKKWSLAIALVCISGQESYLHSSSPSIIHRDLKPSNIFITNGRGGNYIKIGDYGSAIFHGNTNDSLEKSKAINVPFEHTSGCGTIGYMAPEVHNSISYDDKCDAYSLGRIMMDLFCIEKANFPHNDDMLR